MQVNSIMVVKGVSFFEGQIDGKQMSSASIFVEEKMDEKSGTAKGFRTVEHKCVNADVIKRVFNNDFPMSAEVSLELLVKKGTQSFVVTALKPITKVSPVPQPKAA